MKNKIGILNFQNTIICANITCVKTFIIYNAETYMNEIDEIIAFCSKKCATNYQIPQHKIIKQFNKTYGEFRILHDLHPKIQCIVCKQIINKTDAIKLKDYITHKNDYVCYNNECWDKHIKKTKQIVCNHEVCWEI